MTASTEEAPFRLFDHLPGSWLPTIRAALPEVAEQIITAIRKAVPDYNRALGGAFEGEFRSTVALLLETCLDFLIDPTVSLAACAEKCRELGRFDAALDRDMHGLRTAYDTALGVALGTAARILTEAGQPPMVLGQVNKQIFTFITGCTSASFTAFDEVRHSQDAPRERLRIRFLRELLRPDRMPDEDFAKLMRDAGWPLEETLGTAVALEARGEPDQTGLRHVSEAFANLTAERPFLFVPGELTPGLQARLVRALPGYRLAVGFTVPLEKAADSLRWARDLLTLSASDAEPAPLLWCEDNRFTLLLHADPALADLVTGPLVAILSQVEEKEEVARARRPGQEDRYLVGDFALWAARLETMASLGKIREVGSDGMKKRLDIVREAIGWEGQSWETRVALALALYVMAEQQAR